MKDVVEPSLEIQRANSGPAVHRFDELCQTMPIELFSTQSDILGSDGLKYRVSTHVLRPLSTKFVDKKTGEVTEVTPDQQAEQLGNIDNPKPAAAGIFYLTRSRDEGQIQLEYYLAETTEHEYLAGSMIDFGLPLEQIQRSLSTEKGIRLPTVPGIQTISLTVIFLKIQLRVK